MAFEHLCDLGKDLLANHHVLAIPVFGTFRHFVLDVALGSLVLFAHVVVVEGVAGTRVSKESEKARRTCASGRAK